MPRNYKAKRVILEEVTKEGEVWRDIPDFNGQYKISSLGRIYSVVSMHLLTLGVNITNGYVQVPIGKRGARKNFRVHRLVAIAFIPNPLNKKEVNHKNKNKLDNTVDNLEWNTGFENALHKEGTPIWTSDAGRISYYYTKGRNKLKGFAEKAIPMLEKMIPLNGNPFQEARTRAK